jgi:hypothetical protein
MCDTVTESTANYQNMHPSVIEYRITHSLGDFCLRIRLFLVESSKRLVAHLTDFCALLVWSLIIAKQTGDRRHWQCYQYQE